LISCAQFLEVAGACGLRGASFGHMTGHKSPSIGRKSIRNSPKKTCSRSIPVALVSRGLEWARHVSGAI